jgi:ferredoxin-NADP reductase
LLWSGPTRLVRSIADTPLIFFAAIMLTEPLTTPPTKTLRMLYGALVGFLIAPQMHFGNVFTTPELALIIGNIYSFWVSPKYKLILILKEKIKLTHDVFDFVFVPDKQINFTPGQYMEFTLEHSKPDDRGNRRYLSLASSPFDKEIRIGVKFGFPPSSFKKGLMAMESGEKIVAGQLIGDFILPKDPSRKLVFMAGGIGITPFRSMVKYLIDINQKRDIVIVYSAKTASEFVYTNVFKEAWDKLGIRTIYIDSENQGHIDAARLSREISDYKERTFYISGSHGVVDSFEQILKNLHVPARQVVTDYFPGFA